MFTARLLGGMGAISCPPRRIVPSVGVSNPASIRIIVVLPQPEGPSSAKNSCSKISSVWLSIAVNSPNRLVTFLNWISGFASGSFHGSNVVCAMPVPQCRKRPAQAMPRGPEEPGASGARLDLGPHPGDDALHLGRVGRCGVEV